MSINSGPSIKIRLTAAQRMALAEALPDLAGRLQSDTDGQRTIEFTLDEAVLIEIAAEDYEINARNGLKRNSFRHIREITREAIENSKGLGGIPPSERIYQFKVSIRDIEPPIWRRIQTRDCPLDRLHEIIQLVFGWWNYHLHRFKIGEQEYADPQLMAEGFEEYGMINSKTTKLSQIVPKDGRRFSFEYEYDFGDDWIHDVRFEGCLHAMPGVQYPLCVEGARACPPEDVGGPFGYTEYVQAMTNPKHEDYRSLMKWRGPYDPEAFDADQATLALRKGMPRPVDY